MPLRKANSNGTTLDHEAPMPGTTQVSNSTLAAETAAPAVPKAAFKQKASSTSKATDKESYWENKEARDIRKEERDIETGKRIRRSGVWQAALQSMAGLQFNQGGTIESYLELVDKLAEHGLKWVNKD